VDAAAVEAPTTQDQPQPVVEVVTLENPVVVIDAPIPA
jgi:hypothetical protein